MMLAEPGACRAGSSPLTKRRARRLPSSTGRPGDVAKVGMSMATPSSRICFTMLSFRGRSSSWDSVSEGSSWMSARTTTCQVKSHTVKTLTASAMPSRMGLQMQSVHQHDCPPQLLRAQQPRMELGT